MVKIIGGIVTYNPDIIRLKDCIDSIIQEIDDLIIIDNCSDNIEDLSKLVEQYNKVIFLKNSQNDGIANALSEIMRISILKGAEWVLTLDQDSVAEFELINEYRKYIKKEIGILTCRIKDRSCGSYHENDQILDVKECISSGCLMSVEAYQKTQGYDGNFFIDFVDEDICYSLREEGYRIVRIPYEGLLHEYGNNSFYVHCLNRKILISNHPSWRKFYMARNKIIVLKKHPSCINATQVLEYELGIIIKSMYEGNSLTRIMNIIKGVIAGIIYRE